MSSNQINIKFEFLGTAKKTSKSQGQVLKNLDAPASLSKCFEKLIQINPSIGKLVDQSNWRLNRGYLMSINGERFSSALDVMVESDCEIILFSADVGG